MGDQRLYSPCDYPLGGPYPSWSICGRPGRVDQGGRCALHPQKKLWPVDPDEEIVTYITPEPVDIPAHRAEGIIEAEALDQRRGGA